jgi:hypothetical protein
MSIPTRHLIKSLAVWECDKCDLPGNNNNKWVPDNVVKFVSIAGKIVLYKSYLKPIQILFRIPLQIIYKNGK